MSDEPTIKIPLRDVDIRVELEVWSTNGIGDICYARGEWMGCKVETLLDTNDVYSAQDWTDEEFDRYFDEGHGPLGLKVWVQVV